MFDRYYENKDNLNRLQVAVRDIVTELRITKMNAEMLSASVGRLERLLVVYEKHTENPSEAKNKVSLFSDLGFEYRSLKILSEGMDDSLQGIQAMRDVEGTISGRLIELRNRVVQALRRAEQILRI